MPILMCFEHHHSKNPPILSVTILVRLSEFQQTAWYKVLVADAEWLKRLASCLDGADSFPSLSWIFTARFYDKFSLALAIFGGESYFYAVEAWGCEGVLSFARAVGVESHHWEYRPRGHSSCVIIARETVRAGRVILFKKFMDCLLRSDSPRHCRRCRHSQHYYT